ncbi:DNA repair protein RecO [Oscillospiraceae bacterium OttesenSCG-928-F05]|nr:DNA repair protein RecO [Oscillospiraceae bacterium OttesenSCG-928-F05]
MSKANQLAIDALVLRETVYRDSDKMLTLLGERGKFSALVRGGRTGKSRLRAGTQLLTYTSFTLFESRGRYTVDGADPIEFFHGIRDDIECLALASYFAEILEALSDEDYPTPGLLQTGLNCLYALSRKKRPPKEIKAAFELRSAALAGYYPDLERCAACGHEAVSDPIFDLAGGTVICGGCRKTAEGGVKLTEEALGAMRHVLRAEPKRLLHFTLQEALEFGRAAEGYLLDKLGHTPASLKFYRSLPDV